MNLRVFGDSIEDAEDKTNAPQLHRTIYDGLLCAIGAALLSLRKKQTPNYSSQLCLK